jgi:DNA-binding transcriptional ArsR family regulator
MTYGTALSALADPTRRAIFESLAGGPLSVGDLAAERPVSRPAVSQHLRVLKDAGLVCETRHGTRRIYAVEPAGLTALRAWLEQFWDDALVSYKEALEQSDEPD